eukprot:752030-Hanusia_phi.AAC.1
MLASSSHSIELLRLLSSCSLQQVGHELLVDEYKHLQPHASERVISSACCCSDRLIMHEGILNLKQNLMKPESRQHLPSATSDVKSPALCGNAKKDPCSRWGNLLSP